jgi:hypothetical protein
MAVMMGNLYSALKQAGADEESARKAAEEVAGFENRISSLAADITLLKWMVGFNLAMTVAIAARLFLSGLQV